MRRCTSPVNATLIGDTVTIEGVTTGQSWTGIVGDGVETTSIFAGGRQFSFDVGDSMLDVRFISGADFSFGATWLANFLDLDWVGVPSGEIVGFDLSLVGSIGNLTESNVTFDAHNVFVDLNNTNGWTVGEGFTISLITSHAPIPAPATLALFGLGLAGLGWSRRKKA